jgi:alanyl aminopeptidase
MPIRSIRLLLISTACLFCLFSCNDATDKPAVNSSSKAVTETAALEADIPYGQLDKDVNPTAYELSLTIIPELDGFTGTAAIDLEITGSRQHFYLHGKDLTAQKVQLITAQGEFDGTYEQVDESGIARVSWSQPLQGEVRVEIQYSAPFNPALLVLNNVS